MAERGPPAPKLPTMHKPTKIKATEHARIIHLPQQNPPLEPEVVVVPPDQVPDLAPPKPTRAFCPCSPSAHTKSSTTTKPSSACT